MFVVIIWGGFFISETSNINQVYLPYKF